MKTIHIRESFKRGWELFKANKKLLISSSLISFALSISFGDNGKHILPLWYYIVGGIIFVVLSVISIFVKIGLTKITLKLDRGEPTSLSELFEYKELFWKYLGSTILFGLLVALGLILLIIPGIYWMLTYIFVPTLVVDRNISIRDSFKESARMSAGIKWKLLGFMFVTLLINIVGALFLGIGLLVTVPVSLLAFARLYNSLGVSAPAESVSTA